MISGGLNSSLRGGFVLGPGRFTFLSAPGWPRGRAGLTLDPGLVHFEVGPGGFFDRRWAMDEKAVSGGGKPG